MSVEAYVGLGANLGEARATLEQALHALQRLPQTTLLARSPFYRTAPVEAQGPDFVNAVAVLRTGLGAAELLAQLQGVEDAHGRARPYRNAPRTLDLDLLLYGDERIDTPTLTVPHPRLHLRAFVLRPLLDVAPALQVPGIGPLDARLAEVQDQPIERLVT